ncbi:hypothetical protein BP5796_12562 [Coleophoma crateriformis]|uniref:Uncharacterized protein n=1 Tax=Coleophoma crateriformis TaxID=565419 RepID=A0A3D8Q7I2_9HELO|nr:hypothetical protein BP5796_12562 [Coleophoma crateriformis]
MVYITQFKLTAASKHFTLVANCRARSLHQIYHHERGVLERALVLLVITARYLLHHSRTLYYQRLDKFAMADLEQSLSAIATAANPSTEKEDFGRGAQNASRPVLPWINDRSHVQRL